ncbi:structural maintenance of chromosomes flexible hinge domain-containing protein GMI1-like isoform X2 [Beta vulgaris subsp. vulgaris]|uniref:structural maintenance of chromosomes flexible hinge domain-containing protein GMI1-like isoform X2 n=1 Tax=Beta vulgaris subsp. vulgaris TaxID=3555 RepID=UPI00254810DF|nr:structural maintenance of chromosomes flexible hinge domain-containing protein GMI1-like isoform X2 [Beta vulgaris subsp. vulgaris]
MRSILIFHHMQVQESVCSFYLQASPTSARHAIVSAKTEPSKKVFWLPLERDALLRRSGSHPNCTAAGGLRDPSDREIELSPHGCFTEIVRKPKSELPDIFQLQCKLKKTQLY